MSTINSAIFKKIVPISESDSNYENYEFLLGWYGRDGQFIVKMFTDLEASDDVSNSIINLSSSSSLKNIIASKERNRIVTAENLTLNDLQVLSSIFEAKEIIRIFKDGTTEKVGLNSNTLRYRQSNGRHNLPINIVLYEKALPQ